MLIQKPLFPSEDQQLKSISNEQKNTLVEIVAEIIKHSYQQKQERTHKNEQRKNQSQSSK